MQQTGSSGHDENPFLTIFYEEKGGKHADKKIKNYASNTIACM